MKTCLGINYEQQGYGIIFPLEQFNDDSKYKDYSVSCWYLYNQSKGKYSVSMWIRRNDIAGSFSLKSEGIDKQYISSTQETIREDICRIVEQAMKNRFFDKYIDRFEHDIKCFDKGYEYFEQEGSQS